jgi:hypothetical protein
MNNRHEGATSDVPMIRGTGIAPPNSDVGGIRAQGVGGVGFGRDGEVLSRSAAKTTPPVGSSSSLPSLLLEVRVQPVQVSDEPPPTRLHPVLEVVELVHRVFLTFLHSVGMRSLWSRGHASRQHPGPLDRLSLATLVAALALPMSFSAVAQGFGDASRAPNVFAAALIQGRATAPIPLRPGQFTKILETLQARSGSNEPVSILAARVLSFKQQPRCGRVQYAFGQPTAKIVFAAFAGQMNVCEDGQPPLRTCPDRPTVLIPANGACPSGKPPVDTEEVAAAIRAAGGVTQEQMLHAWLRQVDAHAHEAAKTAATAASTAASTSSRSSSKERK